MMKTISLSDKNYFNIFIGKRILKAEVFNSKSSIPVYSANVFNPLGFLDSSNIDDFEHNYLLWGIDGKFEFNIMKKGIKFATTDHCGAIKILDDRIVPEYLLYELRLKSHALGFDRSLRSSLKNMNRLVEVDIPINSKGDLDTQTQIEIAKKYTLLEKVRERANKLSEEISLTLVNVNASDNCKLFEVNKLFDFPPINSGITKEFCNKNKGDIPVYSGISNTQKEPLGYIKDNLDGMRYYEDKLTWDRVASINQFEYIKGRFSTNESRYIMSVKSEYKNMIDPLYFKYVLETKVKELGFGFTNKLGKTKLSKIEIPVPIDSKGNPSPTEQVKIRNLYENIDLIKEKLIENLDELGEVSVEIRV